MAVGRADFNLDRTRALDQPHIDPSIGVAQFELDFPRRDVCGGLGCVRWLGCVPGGKVCRQGRRGVALVRALGHRRQRVRAREHRRGHRENVGSRLGPRRATGLAERDRGCEAGIRIAGGPETGTAEVPAAVGVTRSPRSLESTLWTGCRGRNEHGLKSQYPRFRKAVVAP